MKKVFAAAAALIIVASLSGCAESPKLVVGDCVNVVVDYSSLATNQNISTCVPVSEETQAIDVLSNAGLSLTGTDKYGLQIVCRVNNLPSTSMQIGIKDHENYIEPCTNMPPEFAYWALLIKKANGDWEWAPKGVAQLTLVAGESIGLVFSENGNTKFPG